MKCFLPTISLLLLMALFLVACQFPGGVAGDLKPPPAPLSVSAIDGALSTTITWAPVTGATRYTVYWGNEPGVNKASGTPIREAISPCRHANLTRGARYFYIVTAENVAGESSPSNEVTAVARPSSPLELNVVMGINGAMLNWDIVSGADSYRVEWSTSPEFAGTSTSQKESSSSSVILTELNGGQTYYLRLFAIDSGLSSLPTATVTIVAVGYMFSLSGSDVIIEGYRGAFPSADLPKTFMGRLTTKIGLGAFHDRADLHGVLRIPDSITSIEDGAFANCWGLTGPLTIPNSVVSIGDLAFASCSGITGPVTFPDSITSISDGSFFECTGLTGPLEIPASVAFIGNYAFKGCVGLTGSLVLPVATVSIGVSAFDGCTGLVGQLTFPSTLRTIGEASFRNCMGLTGGVTLPSTVTEIGPSAFEGCSNLNGSLTLSAPLSSIGARAFFGCSALTGPVTFPSSILFIGDAAFSGCRSLVTIVCLASNPPIGVTTSTFEGCDLLNQIQVDSESVNVYKLAVGWKTWSMIIRSRT